MNLEDIRGIIVPLITPVDEKEKIDEAKLRFMVNRVVDGGVNGILVFGSNGEFYMFDEKEHERGLKAVIDENGGRVPVYYGIGSIGTAQGVREARMAASAGADGVSVLQTMFIKPTEQGLYRHFRTIAEAVPDTYVLLYNNPGRCGYGLTADLVEKLARDVKNIVGIKDSSGNFTLVSELIRRTRDIGFKVFTGKDTMVFGGLCMGSSGGVCSIANLFPRLVCGIYNKFMAGDYIGAREDQFRLNPVRLSQDAASFPVATKDMANMIGLDVGNPVLPSEPSEGEVLEKMRRCIEEADLFQEDSVPSAEKQG